MENSDETSSNKEFDKAAAEEDRLLQKWLIGVRCHGRKGLFYRSSPNHRLGSGYKTSAVFRREAMTERSSFFTRCPHVNGLPTRREVKRIGTTTPAGWPTSGV